MPTFAWIARFRRDFERLSADDQARFLAAVQMFATALPHGSLPAGLRVKQVQGYPGVYEITWAPDGRATFEYGAAVISGEIHIIWRRIGTHDIFRDP